MLGYGIHTAECSVLRYTVQWDIMTVMITVTDQTGLIIQYTWMYINYKLFLKWSSSTFYIKINVKCQHFLMSLINF